MTPYNRVLILVGGAALIASLTIAVIFASTNAVDAKLQSDDATAHRLQALGDEYATATHQQREALDEYLLSGDPQPLARFRQAVTDEANVAAQIRSGAGDLNGVADAIAAAVSQTEEWRADIADPDIAAMESGSAEAIRHAIQGEIQDQEQTESATNELRNTIDAVVADLAVQSSSLNALRTAATASGVAVELLAAALSLWFVRRFGLLVARDSARRASAAVERIEIVASLRTLRTQATPEATAAVIAESLHRLPGVDVAGVFDASGQRLLALAIVGVPGFPIQSGDAAPESRASYLLERSAAGPWAERWTKPANATGYELGLDAVGIKSQAYAPIRADGELVGLIALATTDEHHALHLVEDLPAVGEFASVAEKILAPELVARRDREARRTAFAVTIEASAFQPVFQPIVELSTGATIGFEALTRFADGVRPDVIFAAASACGMGIELETATLEKAIEESIDLPADAWLSLNVSPTLLAQPTTLLGLLAARARAIVLEITEHEPIADYAPLRIAMLAMGPGVKLAVDDAGAGVANFNHLVGLRPDFVKIDAGLVHGVDADASRRAVVVGLIHFAAEAGCKVIAEGIETHEERVTLIDLGVTLGQGFLLARPAPVGMWDVPLTAVGTPRRSAPAAPIVAFGPVRTTSRSAPAVLAAPAPATTFVVPALSIAQLSRQTPALRRHKPPGQR